MSAELGSPYTSEAEFTGSGGGGLTVSEDDKLLCARTNMQRMLAGDSLSKELVESCIEDSDTTKMRFDCPVGVCDVSYVLDMSDGSMSRGVEGCAVITAGLVKAAQERRHGPSGITFAEFAQTPLGKKTVK